MVGRRDGRRTEVLGPAQSWQQSAGICFPDSRARAACKSAGLAALCSRMFAWRTRQHQQRHPGGRQHNSSERLGWGRQAQGNAHVVAALSDSTGCGAKTRQTREQRQAGQHRGRPATRSTARWIARTRRRREDFGAAMPPSPCRAPCVAAPVATTRLASCRRPQGSSAAATVDGSRRTAARAAAGVGG